MRANLTQRLKNRFSTSGRFQTTEDTIDERFCTPRAQASSARSVQSHNDASTIPKNLNDDCSRSSFSSLSSSASYSSQFETNSRLNENTLRIQRAYSRSLSDSVQRNKENEIPLFQQKIVRSSDISKRVSNAPNRPFTAHGSSHDSFPRPFSCTNAYPNNFHSGEIFSFARHGKVEAVASLLSQGVSADSRDENGNTILCVACQNGNKRIVKLALRHGANINCKNYRGNTALHFCYRYGFGSILGNYLIQQGADPLIRNGEGWTCLDEGKIADHH